MNSVSLASERSTPDRFVGALPPHPRLPPLPRRRTPTRNRQDKRTHYDYGRKTMITKRSKKSQRRLDKTFKNGILHNQVASFSMHIWLIFR